MSCYSHLTDPQLAAEIAEYRAALKEFNLRQVAVVAGEGRRVEFASRDGRNNLNNELRNLVAEYNRRTGGSDCGGSLGLEIG